MIDKLGFNFSPRMSKGIAAITGLMRLLSNEMISFESRLRNMRHNSALGSELPAIAEAIAKLGLVQSIEQIEFIHLMKKRDYIISESVEQAMIILFMNHKEREAFHAKCVFAQRKLDELNRNVSTLAKMSTLDDASRYDLRELLTVSESLIKTIATLRTWIDFVLGANELEKVHYQMMQRQNFKIDPREVNPDLSGSINIVIRHLVGPADQYEKVFAFSCFLEGVSKAGSALGYQASLEILMRRVLVDMLKKRSGLLTCVYGKKLNFTFYFDIMPPQAFGNLGSVMNMVKKAFGGKAEVNALKFDPSLRALEMHLACDFVLKAAFENDAQEQLVSTVTHEINHLFDRQLANEKIKRIGKSDVFNFWELIRAEGLASFSEFVFSRDIHKARISRGNAFWPINSMVERPIETVHGFEALNEFSGRQLAYIAGEYMCFVIYLGLLQKKYPFVRGAVGRRDVADIPLLLSITSTKEYVNYAEVVLRSIRSVPGPEFAKMFERFNKELGFKPIFARLDY